MTLTTNPKFDLGQCRATMGALGALEDNGTHAIVFLRRHQEGDWGTLSADDLAANEMALEDGSRILSAYMLADLQKIWVITDAADDEGIRQTTCIMLPEEY